MFEVNNIFPSPVYSVFLEDSDLLNVYVKSHLYTLRERQHTGFDSPGADRRGTWISHRGLHEESTFKVLFESVRMKLQGLAETHEIGVNKPRCTAMWGDITDRYGYHQSHGGEACKIKGIYFVQTPDNAGQLFFHDPRVGNQKEGGLQEQAMFNMTEGQLLIFPSWLSYSLSANRSELNGDEGNRINVKFSFN